MSLFESSKDFRRDYARDLCIFASDSMVHAFDEDALILHRLLGYRLILLGTDTPYIKTSFSLSALNRVTKRIADVVKLPIRIYSVLPDATIQEKRYITFRSALVKSDYVRSSDVVAKMSEIREFGEHEKSVAVQNFQIRTDERFELHEKTKDCLDRIIAAITRYMSKAYRASIGDRYIGEWVGLMSETNRLRSIPEHIRSNYGELVRYKINILIRISVMIDTLRDLTDSVFAFRGFKNRDQYLFLQLRISELGKINRGILLVNEKKLQEIVL